MSKDIRKYPCPDCGSKWTKKNVNLHQPTCPIGSSLDSTMDADRQYFLDNPWASEYMRDPELCDIDVIRRGFPIDLPPGTWHGQVRVVQIEPGLRMRDYSNIWFAMDSVE